MQQSERLASFTFLIFRHFYFLFYFPVVIRKTFLCKTLFSRHLCDGKCYFTAESYCNDQQQSGFLQASFHLELLLVPKDKWQVIVQNLILSYTVIHHMAGLLCVLEDFSVKQGFNFSLNGVNDETTQRTNQQWRLECILKKKVCSFVKET